MSLADNVEYLRRLRELSGITGFGELNGQPRSAPDSGLVEVEQFGSNPGKLKMYSYIPPQRPHAMPLVVVLHGCGQSAADYDLGAGWSTLAKHFGFAVLLPEQQRMNNGQRCFNWFQSEDITRDEGEVASIRQMIARMVADRAIDQRRVFITGLSAGGAMTMAMLSNYPEIFAGGAVIAGLPFGVARNVRDALMQMRMPPARGGAELGDLVRRASSSFRGRWPKLSVWQGTADRTVHPDNADEIIKQWLDLHRLPLGPMAESDVDGHSRQVWWNSAGEPMVESFTITDMAHGTPIGLAENDKRYGKQGPFLLEAGISSSYHIAKFFGVTDWIRQPKPAVKPVVDSPSARLIPSVSPITAVLPVIARKLWSKATEATEIKATEVNSSDVKPSDVRASDQKTTAAKPLAPKPETSRHEAPKREARRAPVDVAGVIERALQAAGLKK